MKTQSTFRFKKFSPKQLRVLTWWTDNSPVKDMDGIIADGAIRSGKTITMSLSFVMWAMTRFDNSIFAMCGKTVGSFRRNVLLWLKIMLVARGYSYQDRRADNLVIVRKGGVENSFYIFGGKDEGSQELIQGITLSGVFFDEVALMPESFVNQATARCSVDGSKWWFNCNPQNPMHWFRVEWILKWSKKRLVYLHFTMDDNYSLSENMKARYRSMYTGVFYDRFIRGLWVAAEGLIFEQFATNQDRWIFQPEDKKWRRDIDFISIGVDFGGNKSKTVFVASAILRGYEGVVVIADHKLDGEKGSIDPDKVNKDFVAFIQKVQKEYPECFIKYGFADSAEQYLIAGIIGALRKAGLTIKFGDALKAPINDRIRCKSALINTDRWRVLSTCNHVINSTKELLWDQEEQEDVRLDDLSTDVDTADAEEYSWERFIKHFELRRAAS